MEEVVLKFSNALAKKAKKGHWFEIERHLDSKVKFRVSSPLDRGHNGAFGVLQPISEFLRPSDGTNRESGFDLRAILLPRKGSLPAPREKQKFELDWLKLRTRVVQAQIVTNQARLAENTLAQEMARYGSLDRRFPDAQGFIDPIQRKGWDAKLLQRPRGFSAGTRASSARRRGVRAY